MSTAPLPGSIYLEDLAVGAVFHSGEHAVDEKQIMEFARKYDPQPFHMDAKAAEGSFFKGLAASGWHTAAITMKLLVQSLPLAGGLIGAGGEVKWPTATRPGDILKVVSRITEIRNSQSDPGRAYILAESHTTNQNAAIRQVMTSRLVVFSKNHSNL